MHEPLIRLTDIHKSYGANHVLRGISLEVEKSEVLVIIGPSGGGKSTLLRHIIGVMKPTSGSVKIFGEEITTMKERQIEEIRRRFGMLFQSGALLASLTVGENVALPLQEHTTLDSNIIEITVKIKLELVGLREHADKYPAQISGGMKKRAGDIEQERAGDHRNRDES